jgi:hypothetical protein
MLSSIDRSHHSGAANLRSSSLGCCDPANTAADRRAGRLRRTPVMSRTSSADDDVKRDRTSRASRSSDAEKRMTSWGLCRRLSRTSAGKEDRDDDRETAPAGAGLFAIMTTIKLKSQNELKRRRMSEDNLPGGERARALRRLKRPGGRKAGGRLARLRGMDEPAAWGAITFPGASESNVLRPPSKWCAFSADSKQDDVLDLLTKTWRLAFPHVIISVTGAAVGSIPDLSPVDREVFQLGLLGAVRATKAWVVTGGTDGGVMELVGKTSTRHTALERMGWVRAPLCGRSPRPAFASRAPQWRDRDKRRAPSASASLRGAS